MTRKTNQKGRNLSVGPYVQLPHFLMDSAAYRSLTATAQALLVQVIRRYKGHNNGYIGFSHRDAANTCNVNKDTIKRYFDELEAKGFIAIRAKGGFNLKDSTASRATEWRITWLDAEGEKATHDYKRWQPVGAL